MPEIRPVPEIRVVREVRFNVADLMTIVMALQGCGPLEAHAYIVAAERYVAEYEDSEAPDA